jgi:hypothetical protein
LGISDNVETPRARGKNREGREDNLGCVRGPGVEVEAEPGQMLGEVELQYLSLIEVVVRDGHCNLRL